MINGIFNVYKEKGWTSNDVVCRMRGILRQKKVGHTGTLDPNAEGVLPICTGSATKLCEFLTDHDKEYVAVFRLGIVTDTQDMSGTVLRESEPHVDERQLCKTISTFVGGYEQIPPMYSALKVNGKKLYEYAREGITIERKPRVVRIDEITMLNIAFPEVTIRVNCSKGTYIRTLCADIGEKLGCGAAMSSLERTRVGKFHVQNALTLTRLEQLRDEGRLEEVVVPVDRPLQIYPAAIPINERMLSAIKNGNAIRPDRLLPHGEIDPVRWGQVFSGQPEGGKLRIYDSAGQFLALYRYCVERNMYVPDKMFL